MRIYKYWTRKSELMPDGETICCRGISDKSIADAENIIKLKIELFRKIHKERRFSREIKDQLLKLSGISVSDESYETPICEDIIKILDEKNIITRNRYGALVLNSRDHVFIDIDALPLSVFDKFKITFFKHKKTSEKERIIKMIEETAKAEYDNLSFRIYETAKGIRLLVSGDKFLPSSTETKKLFRAFHADKLYGRLCSSQDCFRARLTPKPVRIDMKPCSNFNCPNASEADRVKMNNWVSEYDFKAQNYSTCRLLLQIGKEKKSPVMDYHDDLTKIQSKLTLA